MRFNEREILQNAGKISKELAEKKALQQYELYNQRRVQRADEEAAMQIKELEELK